jgi:hypothetical protein
MALFTEAALRQRGLEYRSKTFRLAESADTILRKAASTHETTFDIFLSHSLKDSDLVLGVYAMLTAHGLKVYVDWMIDGELDRSRVTPETAERLRERMRQSSSLIYVHSTQSPDSKWMPWELGYFDGFRSAVAVLPIARTEQNSFAGQEYLGLYPYIDGSTLSLWVNRAAAPRRFFRGPESYKNFTTWLSEQR